MSEMIIFFINKIGGTNFNFFAIVAIAVIEHLSHFQRPYFGDTIVSKWKKKANGIMADWNNKNMEILITIDGCRREWPKNKWRVFE